MPLLKQNEFSQPLFVLILYKKSKEFTVQQLSEESPIVGTNVYALPAAAEAEWRFSYRFSKTRSNHLGTLAFGFSLIALIILAVKF